MQSPEVWTFKEPSSSFHIQEFKKLPQNIIKGFHFNHLVSVVIPECLRIPQNLIESLTDDCEYYKIYDINLAYLLNSAFVNHFVKQGNLSALSVGTRIDCDNCVAVTPTGHLLLEVNKDTYQSLGLEGNTSHFTKKNRDRYIIKLDLKDAKLQAGKKYYERIKDAFESFEKFSLILAWEPPQEKICPSSIAKYFHNLGCNVKICKPTFKTHVLYSIDTPMIWREEVEESDVADFVEWLGMIAIDGDFLGSHDNYVNTYEVSKPSVVLGQLRFLQWRGLYSYTHLEKLLSFLEEFNENEKKCWISVYVQGFSDMPIVSGNQEHHYYTNGDNGSLLIFNENRFLSFTHRCTSKMYK